MSLEKKLRTLLAKQKIAANSPEQEELARSLYRPLQHLTRVTNIKTGFFPGGVTFSLMKGSWSTLIEIEFADFGWEVRIIGKGWEDFFKGTTQRNPTKIFTSIKMLWKRNQEDREGQPALTEIGQLEKILPKPLMKIVGATSYKSKLYPQGLDITLLGDGWKLLFRYTKAGNRGPEWLVRLGYLSEGGGTWLEKFSSDSSRDLSGGDYMAILRGVLAVWRKQN